MFFSNGPEYERRLNKDFAPPTISLKDVHNAVPKHLLKRSSLLSSYYVVRDLVLGIAFFAAATKIEPLVGFLRESGVLGGWKLQGVRAGLWLSYWWFQGLVGGGIFCLGHDAGHGTLYPSSIVNNVVGFFLHSLILVPYYAWRSTHHAHHKATGSIERDENYVPHDRGHYGLPPASIAKPRDYAEIFEETPIYTIIRVFIMQAFGWWMYLSMNTLGSHLYPSGTNHFDPNSLLFKKHQWWSIVMSDLGLLGMGGLLAYLGTQYGFGDILKYYVAPWALTNHWIVMFTYLHHSDPTMPHYRKEEWTFLRGATATVDRPLLGWAGRFFLHNISHDHVAHHFFVTAPFYNGPEITKALKTVLKDDYNFDSTNTFYALWRSFSQCLFIEESDKIAFYKNKHGDAVRKLEPGVAARLQAEVEAEETENTRKNEEAEVQKLMAASLGEQGERLKEFGTVGITVSQLRARNIKE